MIDKKGLDLCRHFYVDFLNVFSISFFTLSFFLFLSFLFPRHYIFVRSHGNNPSVFPFQSFLLLSAPLFLSILFFFLALCLSSCLYFLSFSSVLPSFVSRDEFLLFFVYSFISYSFHFFFSLFLSFFRINLTVRRNLSNHFIYKFLLSTY